ncbi:UDP-N-acetylmuramoyl-L-alanyl-D-glutamate--2,6-diaminopimelate ligase [Myxococcus sp. MISCRS1]|uniref:UDP-N-acetylmuramoyl-L-alanyl-D-glutamate--2, 6-diaminopimelate ligase n=1 Tax=Myxococcus TaxID=32 RepID=UPI001CBDD4A3|nr:MULTISPECIES: UDP-N-acetylmuramoyl-L-alanyl-D-glutamate--2,6-diaminopimelate ligase [unclassified Myxococcus]MBZ4410264.1 UDP-N-acetylmuramoyl-L-alanyl-D-glutamate--2,6-diaminopimelate ligase [Myxococcus sp. XM-1-1-1]MCY1001762.1 UDP-N-acetylmuramoyl-L-alanyl-D-glutamate--2,6-diaminopimelate ligase [Myxococcus sp. MISCRS1]BDT36666.1 UDP-N-acetylmuramoyl-L-alanyl-D-glutamate--2,6-diaminopimelate ligase [Myxococcus sp. MH1]
MKLTDVLAGCGAEQTSGGRSAVDVTGVTQDSRHVKPGDLFVAIPGTKEDGAQFIGEAVSRGAVAVVSEKPVPSSQVPFFKVGSARKALALIAANFHGRPADKLTLLAVTGTNGKTTTSFLLEAMSAAAYVSTGVIGTLGYKFGGKTVPTANTTPDPLELHRIFKEMVDAGVETVVMEVSSHALAQERVHGLTFKAAGFSNLSRDHLDYHKDMEDYFQSKRKLFAENLSASGVAVVNGDDTYASRIYNEQRGQKKMAWKFSRQGSGEISASDVTFSLDGIKGTLKTPSGDIALKSKLLGPHNLENILLAVGIGIGAGFSRSDVKVGIERMTPVEGRMERVENYGPGGAPAVLVDYAHTDDALKRALEAARSLAKGRVIVVFGCGGDRDKGKRPLMGQVAAEAADVAVITSDNPRTEDPDDIIAQVTPGLEKAGLRRISAAKVKSGEKGYLVEADRRAAIEQAIGLATGEDVVLIAGKGHETYQQVGQEKHKFDDRQVAATVLAARKPS